MGPLDLDAELAHPLLAKAVNFLVDRSCRPSTATVLWILGLGSGAVSRLLVVATVTFA